MQSKYAYYIFSWLSFNISTITKSFLFLFIFYNTKDQLRQAITLSKAEDSDRSDRIWRCIFAILARAIEDKVFNVYSSSIDCFQNLLSFIQYRHNISFSHLASYIRPILQTILSKCGDSNKRIAELSQYTILKLSSNDNVAINNLSKRMMVPCCNVYNGNFDGDTIQDYSKFKNHFEGIDFILHFINEDRRDPPSHQDNNCKYTIGRLLCINALITGLQSTYFTCAQQKPTYPRLMIALDIVFRHIQHTHPTVYKSARKIFLVLCEMAIMADVTRNYPFIKQLVTSIESSDLKLRFLHRIDYFVVHGQVAPSEIIQEKVIKHLPIKGTCEITNGCPQKSCNKENELLECTSNFKGFSKNDYNKDLRVHTKSNDSKILPKLKFRDISNKPYHIFKVNRCRVNNPSSQSNGSLKNQASFRNETARHLRECGYRKRMKIISPFSQGISRLLGKRKFSQVDGQGISR